jgi:hypothetical protein
MGDINDRDWHPPDHWDTEVVGHRGTADPNSVVLITFLSLMISLAIAAGISLGWSHLATLALFAAALLGPVGMVWSWFFTPGDHTVTYYYDPADPDHGVLEHRKDPSPGVRWFLRQTRRPAPSASIEQTSQSGSV